ncbi:hypothetical protein N9W41_01300 [bacterium]|nr:hypothetical protein [bacterium]
MFKFSKFIFLFVVFQFNIFCVVTADAEVALEECVQETKASFSTGKYLLEEVGHPEVDQAIKMVKEILAGKKGPFQSIDDRFKVTQIFSGILKFNYQSITRRFKSREELIILKTEFSLDNNQKLSVSTDIGYFKKGSIYPLFTIYKDHKFDSSCRYISRNIEFTEYSLSKVNSNLKVTTTSIDLLSNYLTNTKDIIQVESKSFNDIPSDSFYMSMDAGLFAYVLNDKTVSTIKFFDYEKGTETYKINRPSKFNYILTQKEPEKNLRVIVVECDNKQLFQCDFHAIVTTEKVPELNMNASSKDVGSLDWLSQPLYFESQILKDSLPNLGSLNIGSNNRVLIKTISKLKLHNVTEYWSDITQTDSSIEFTLPVGNYEEINSVSIREKAPIEYEKYLSSSEFIEPDNPEIRLWKSKFFDGFKGSRRDALKMINKFIKESLTYDDILAKFEFLDYKTTSTTISRKKGICTDFSNVFVSLARAIGIPARIIVGYQLEPGEDISLELSHAWVEVNLDNKKWTPIEPQSGDFIRGSKSLYIPIDVLTPSSLIDDLRFDLDRSKRVKKILSIEGVS